MDLQWFVKWFNSPYYHILYKNRSLTEAEDFIQKITQTKLDMWRSFKSNSSELKDLIAMQIQVTEAAKKMNLNALLNTSIDADEMNEVGEISDQIEKLEHRFEDKIAEYVRSLI